MIKIEGKDLWRGGQKIGWVDGHHVFAHDGKKLGYFDEKFVYNMEGHKLAYVEGDYLHPYASNTKIPLEKVSEEVEGVGQQSMDKCAVYVLLGD